MNNANTTISVPAPTPVSEHGSRISYMNLAQDNNNQNQVLNQNLGVEMKSQLELETASTTGATSTASVIPVQPQEVPISGISHEDKDSSNSCNSNILQMNELPKSKPIHITLEEIDLELMHTFELIAARKKSNRMLKKTDTKPDSPAAVPVLSISQHSSLQDVNNWKNKHKKQFIEHEANRLKKRLGVY